MFTYLQETTEGVIFYAIKILYLVPPSRFCQLPFIALFDTIDGSWLTQLFTLFITASFLEIQGIPLANRLHTDTEWFLPRGMRMFTLPKYP